MDRIQLNQPATLTAYWERAGVQVDPGTPVTVTVYSDRQAAPILQNAPVTGAPGVSRSITLPPNLTAQLDNLTLTWTAPDGSILTSYAEVCSGYLFSITAARARKPLDDTVQYPTQALLDYRTYAEMALEDICGVAFVQRYRREAVRINSIGMLEPNRRKLNNVLQIWTTSNQGLVPIASMTGLRVERSGLIYMPYFWNWWQSPIWVSYEHGYLWPPPRISRAAIELARRWLIESPWDERMVAFRSREGGEVDILTAKGDPFDLPEVVACAELYGTPLVH